MNDVKAIIRRAGWTLDEIRSYEKNYALAQFRGCLYAFLKYETDYSTVQIGKYLHRKSCTVINVGNRYYYRIHKKGYLKEEYDKIRTLYDRIHINQ